MSQHHRVADLTETTGYQRAKAGNLRQEYWLYVVFDCAATHPRLLRVQDPFAKLLVCAKGGVVVDEASVFEAGEAQ